MHDTVMVFKDSDSIEYLSIVESENSTSVTILWLTCFAGIYFFRPFITNLAPISLQKIPAFFSRSQNKKWPPSKSGKMMKNRTVTICFLYCNNPPRLCDNYLASPQGVWAVNECYLWAMCDKLA